MTINIDPNAAHAVYAPSSAHRWAMENGCSASADAIAKLGEQEEGEEAKEGTAAHDEIERCLDPVAYFANGLKPLPVNPEHPAAYGVALVLDYVQKLWEITVPTGGKMWIEQRVALTEHIWGRCDVAHWDDASSTLTIVDYKNGFVGVDVVENPQLRIYAAASIYTHKLPAKWIRYAVVQPNDFRPVPPVKQWGESAESLFAEISRIAAIPAGPKRFVAGEQCTYCPLFGRCEASKDVLRDVAALVAGLMTPDQVRPEQRALFLACEKPIADAFKNADKLWTKDALKDGPPPGMGLFTAQTRRTWKDVGAARWKVLNHRGLSKVPAEFHEALTKGQFADVPSDVIVHYFMNGVDALDPPTPAQAEKLGIDIGDMAPAPKGGPILAFADDKRKPWAPQTAAEMFKDVVQP